MGFKEKVQLGISICTLGNMGYFIGLALLSCIASMGSPHIPLSNIESVISRERDRLGIPKDIIIRFYESDPRNTARKLKAYSCKIRDKEYGIVLSDSYRDLATLRHELYHLSDGHLDEDMNFFMRGLKTIFYDEPSAILHTLKDREDF